ncbi:MAG: sulfurtransferase TusA family protein [Pikeienuella sp.]
MSEPHEDRSAEEGAQEPGAAELDARGLLCPLPVLKTRKRLQALPPGATLRVLADDPAARIDIPHFCAEQGHALLAEGEEASGALTFLVRKGG